MSDRDRILATLTASEAAMLLAQDPDFPLPVELLGVGDAPVDQLSKPFGAERFGLELLRRLMDKNYAKWLPIYQAKGWVSVRCRQVQRRRKAA